MCADGTGARATDKWHDCCCATIISTGLGIIVDVRQHGRFPGPLLVFQSLETHWRTHQVPQQPGQPLSVILLPDLWSPDDHALPDQQRRRTERPARLFLCPGPGVCRGRQRSCLSLPLQRLDDVCLGLRVGVLQTRQIARRRYNHESLDQRTKGRRTSQFHSVMKSPSGVKTPSETMTCQWGWQERSEEKRCWHMRIPGSTWSLSS